MVLQKNSEIICQICYTNKNYTGQCDYSGGNCDICGTDL